MIYQNLVSMLSASAFGTDLGFDNSWYHAQHHPKIVYYAHRLCLNYLYEHIERFSFEPRKVIGFVFATLHDWLKKFAPVFHPIRSKTKTNRDLLARVFPRFASATCNYFEFWLVHCIVCSLWLARVITLVLVLRHSTENHSIIYNHVFCRVNP